MTRPPQPFLVKHEEHARTHPVDLYLEDSVLQRAHAIAQRLRPMYARYVRDVSNPKSTASLICVALTCSLAERTEGAVLDLGSGFSSAALRTILPGRRIVSVDHSPFWLKKTQEYLSGHQLLRRGSPLLPVERFRKRRLPEGGYGLVFHDLGGGVIRRAATFPWTAPMVARGGILVLDDAHKAELRKGANRLYRGGGWERVDTSQATMDQFGRFAWVFRRSPA